MLFQTNLRKLERVTSAGLAALVVTAVAVLPVAGAEVLGVSGEAIVTSDRDGRWFSAYGVPVGPDLPEAPKHRSDCLPGGVFGVGSDGSEAMLDDIECPEYVALDDFEEVDYGPNAIGITMCKLDSDGPPSTSINGGFTINVGWVSFTIGASTDEGDMCYYAGCELLVSEGEANHAART